MWGQVSMNSALRAFLRGETVKVVDFNAETILSLSEVFQRFAEGTVFFTETVATENFDFSEAVEDMTEDLPPLAQNIEQVEPVSIVPDLNDSVVTTPATVKVTVEKQRGDDTTSYSKDEVRRMVEKVNKQKITDLGKLRALKNAGWSNVKIADEFGCSSQTVANTLKRLEEQEAQA